MAGLFFADREVSLGGGLALLVGSFVLYVLLLGLYNLTLHPLRSYPGPLLWRAYRLPWARARLSGRWHVIISDLHAKYGHVVRVAPDDLSYTDSSVVKPILGHHNPAAEGFSEFDKDRREYIPPPNGVRNLLSAHAVDHGRARRLLSHSFSEKGLREMQPRVQSYVDSLITGLKETVRGGTQATDIVQWFNWTTFDILGDLAFGESFHCLESKRNDPWIQAIFGNVKAGVFITVAQRYSIAWLLPYITPKRLFEQRRINLARSAEKIEQRIKLGTGRGDFWDTVLEKSSFEKGTGMSKEEMTRNADLLVLAGSETTATLLSGTTYLLLKNPHVMKKLAHEVRSSFKSEKEIDFISVNRLDYMLAVFDEALRVYPPVAHQGHRLVPSGGAMLAGKLVPGGTSVMLQPYSANHSPSNFHLPESFVPERWLPNPPSEFANDDRAARIPFSVGPRNCIGRNLAYSEMRLILSKIIWNFDLELDEARSRDWIKEQKAYTLWEKGPLWVRLNAVKR